MEEDVFLSPPDEIVTMKDDKGLPVKFYELAAVIYRGDIYSIMQPVDPVDGVAPDEAIVFKTEEGPGDEDNFMPVEDDMLADLLFNRYLKKLNGPQQ